MKTEKQIKDRIKEIKFEDKKLKKAEIEFIEQKNELESSKISLWRSGLFQELCVLKWVLAKSKITLAKITHNDIMKKMGAIKVKKNSKK